MRRRVLGPVLAAAILAAGCGSGGPAPAPAAPVATSPAPATVRPPASPADSPPLAVPPAGTVVGVGPGAEGVVVDTATGLVAVGVREPDQLVLIDAATGAVRTRTALPGHLRHLQNGGPGTLLVPDEDSGRLLTVALPAGRIVAELPTGVSPHYAVTTPDGTIFVANEGGHSVAVVRGGQVVASLPDAVMPGGMAVVGGRLGLVDVAGDTLTLYDTTTLARLASVPLGDGPTHEVADDRGDLVVADTRAQALLFVSPEVPPVMRLRLPLAGTPYGLAYDASRDRLWATLPALNQVVGFDTRADPPREIARFPTVRQPNTVAVDPRTGTVFVTGATDGVLETIPAPA